MVNPTLAYLKRIDLLLIWSRCTIYAWTKLFHSVLKKYWIRLYRAKLGPLKPPSKLGFERTADRLCTRYTTLKNINKHPASSDCLFVFLSVWLSVYLSVHPSVHSSVCPFVRLSVCPFVRLSVCPFVCLSFLPSYYPSFQLSPYLSVSVCFSLSLSLCLSVCLSSCLSPCLFVCRM